jgi:drug/metabolite transporter (DMT)-like permease
MWRGIVSGLLAGAFWGAVFIVPVLLPDFSPAELMVGRYLCYGALAAGLMLPRLLPLLRRLRRGDWLAMSCITCCWRMASNWPAWHPRR